VALGGGGVQENLLTFIAFLALPRLNPGIKTLIVSPSKIRRESETFRNTPEANPATLLLEKPRALLRKVLTKSTSSRVRGATTPSRAAARNLKAWVSCELIPKCGSDKPCARAITTRCECEGSRVLRAVKCSEDEAASYVAV
jgi:hypothetical protein